MAKKAKTWRKKPKPGSKADSRQAQAEAWKASRNYAIRGTWRSENAKTAPSPGWDWRG